MLAGKAETPPSEGRDDEVFGRGFMEGVLQSSTDCIKILDLDGCLLFMNPVGLRLMEIDSIHQVAGTAWVDFWDPEQAVNPRRALEAARAGRSYRFQAPCPTVKGTLKWWDVSVSPIKGAGNKIERILSISRDHTEQRSGTPLQ